jgi:hypothetical protein
MKGKTRRVDALAATSPTVKKEKRMKRRGGQLYSMLEPAER